MPAPINSPGINYCRYITTDGKYFVFTGNRTNPQSADGKTKTCRQLKQILSGPANGFYDLYRVKFSKVWQVQKRKFTPLYRKPSGAGTPDPDSYRDNWEVLYLLSPFRTTFY